jgi:hypothetical protein
VKAIVGLMAIGGVCIAIFLFLIWNSVREQGEIRKLDDSEKYVIDFSPLLGKEWEVSRPFQDDESIVGWDFNLAGRTVLSTYYTSDHLAYVTHHVLSYPNDGTALNGYFDIEDWVIVRDYGVPPSRQVYSYEDIQFPANTNPHADKQRIACVVVSNLNNTECVGLLVYDNHVVFAAISTIVDSIEYVTMTGLQKVFSAIDEKMVSTT